jgi:putative N6-adenine-specific DNA methylase
LIPSNTTRFIAKTLAGLESVLASELLELGATEIEILTRAVAFTGTKETVYKANYLCRTAIKILVPLAEFEATTNDELYEGVKRVEWDTIMSFRDTFVVEAVLVNSAFTHSHYISLKVKDAVADWFVEKFKRRPDVDKDNPDISLSLFVSGKNCILYLDSSGEPTYKRGYRQAIGLAPINEALAAGMIMLTGWDKQVNFVDPFCGSGTFLIEAAMLAQNIPAGQFRNEYGFMKWRDFDRTMWNQVKSDAARRIKKQECEIFGSDMSAMAVDHSKQNLKKARLLDDVTLRKARFEETSFDGPGVLISNPPYGERMKNDDIVALYKSIGDTLKKHYLGFDAWIITSDLFALKHLGLHPSRKIHLFNGPLECRFNKFEIYQGSRKASKQGLAADENQQAGEVSANETGLE